MPYIAYMGLYGDIGYIPYMGISLYIPGYRLCTLYGLYTAVYRPIYRGYRLYTVYPYIAYVAVYPYMGISLYLAYIRPMGLYRRNTPVFSLYLAYIPG